MPLILGRNLQSGMGMIEALVALVIISIGLLGIAALQLASLQQSASANWHSQAIWINYEMVDRIHANRQAFAGYGGIDTSLATIQDCQSGNCGSAQMRNADAWEWKAMVEGLPEGRGFVSLNSGLLTVSVMWKDGRSALAREDVDPVDGATNCNNDEADSDNMTCFTVTIQ